MSGNGNGKKRWGSAKIDPVLIDPTGQLGKKSVLPGFQGVPYRGNIPDLRHDDPEHAQPEINYQVHIDVLDLSRKEDMERYQEICQTVMNGFGQMSKEDLQYDPQKKSWRVLVRWMEFFSSAPKGRNYGRIGGVGQTGGPRGR